MQKPSPRAGHCPNVRRIRRTRRAAFPNGATEVYLSRQDVNPDALVGGALTKGPILLVPTCGTLPPAVAAEIRRLDPARVVALGGPNTVCDDILRQAGAA